MKQFVREITIFFVAVITMAITSVGLVFILSSFPGWIPFHPYPLTGYRLSDILLAFVAYGMSAWMDSKRWYLYVLLLPVTGIVTGQLLSARSPLLKADFSFEFLIWFVNFVLEPIIFSFIGGSFYYYRKISD